MPSSRYTLVIVIVFLIILIGVLIGVIVVLNAPSTSPGGYSTGYSNVSRAVGVRIVIIVDNNPYKPGLETAWGLSIYVEAGNVSFLFDTGPSPDVLGANAERLA